MKPSNQSNKNLFANPKNKKNLKDREKRKSQGSNSLESNNHTVSEKGSPTKESNTRLYAGIDSETVINYAEQSAAEHLSEDIINTLTEDVNYRLRYIINDSLIKARLSCKNAISSSDLEHTFENLRLGRVYGAPAHPNWITFGDQNLFCLEDKEISLVEIFQEQNEYQQYSEPILTTKWMPEQTEISKSLKNYFTTMCQMIVNPDFELRRMALINISENPRIGPIIEWFYNFSYILLSKDITYDCLTLRALDLITVLEKSQSCRMNVSEKQLRLLVRLILQRLIKSTTTNEVMKPMCNVLALFCVRYPLKEFVIMKILQKLDEIVPKRMLAVISVANSLGIYGIQRIILPNIDLFFHKIVEPLSVYSILESYYILCKENLIDSLIYQSYSTHFGDSMLLFSTPKIDKTRSVNKKDLNFVYVKGDLLRNRRVISWTRKNNQINNIEEVFEMPPEDSEVRKKINESDWNRDTTKQTKIIIGKTTLLLPVFQKKIKIYSKCHDHTMFNYNL